MITAYILEAARKLELEKLHINETKFSFVLCNQEFLFLISHEKYLFTFLRWGIFLFFISHAIIYFISK